MAEADPGIFAGLAAIPEVSVADVADLDARLRDADRPFVIRGLVADWPLVVAATSARLIRMLAPLPVAARSRSAASTEMTACRPASRSHAGSTLLAGACSVAGPVIPGSPVSALIV